MKVKLIDGLKCRATSKCSYSCFQKLEAEVKEYEPILTKIFEIGEKAVKETSGDVSQDIADELKDVRTVWHQLTTLLTDRGMKIQSVEPLAKKYHEALQQLGQVMTKTETTLKNLKCVGAEPDQVQKDLDKVKVSIMCKKAQSIKVDGSSCLACMIFYHD